MKKLVITALVLLLALAAIGCAAAENPEEATTPARIGNALGEELIPHLGGIKLGDSKDQVIEAFGTDYEEEYFDESFALGEPFVRMLYSNGVTVVLGTDSNTVLEIETTSPKTVTNLAYRVGDKAQEVLDEYRSKYKEPQSRHSEETLTGWFLINAEYELLIFKFDTDETLINENVEPDDQIEGIKLTNFKYMD